ncbi:hypothetical protein E4T56_gene9514, partial [Termitomyces sp. T112]
MQPGMYPVSPERDERNFFFACCEGSETVRVYLPPLYENIGPVGYIAFAQNAQGQHVAVKSVLDGSEELRFSNTF